ncbi:Mobile element protein [Candidatus Enterovibrio altilux]|uniref:Mobile element protein n=1 Tax=Candidatus Enterovibrio altilux TaxID=1927128 RepID=A0A291B6P8_9GAMM|nr:Mobile element protein [Candidatus Enterovibrio luxaltus]
MINSIFKLTQLPLLFPHYSCITKRAKIVNVASKMKIQGIV